MVSRREQTLELPLGGAETDAVCRSVVADLGWQLSERGDGTLVAAEDPSRLHCRRSPLRAELELAPRGIAKTTLAVHGAVSGRGPLAAQHVRSQTDLLTRRIGVEALRASARE